MIKFKRLVVEKREQSINTTREIYFHTVDSFIEKSQIEYITKQCEQHIDPEWWRIKLTEYLEKNNFSMYSIYTKTNLQVNGVILSDEELKILTEDD